MTVKLYRPVAEANKLLEVLKGFLATEPAPTREANPVLWNTIDSHGNAIAYTLNEYLKVGGHDSVLVVMANNTRTPGVGFTYCPNSQGFSSVSPDKVTAKPQWVSAAAVVAFEVYC